MDKYKFESNFENIKNYGEDFILTPYIGLVYHNSPFTKSYGLSIGWGYLARSFEVVIKKKTKF